MSKYIIEIAKEYEEYFKGILICGIADGKFAVDVIAREDLKELNSDYINEHYGSLQDEAYKRGINDGSLDVKQRVEGAYQRGLDDAWEAARKVALNSNDGGLSIEKLDEIFDRYTLQQVLKEYTAKQTIEKLKAYEEKQKHDDRIEVGDEVIYNGTTKCIVVRPEDDERYASLIDSDGTHYSADHRECKKTGRHFDIDKILEAMKA